MTTTLPGWLKTVLDYVGMHFPEGDEDKLAQRERAFGAFAKSLAEIEGDLGKITREIEEAIGGDIEQAVKQFIDELVQQSVAPQEQNQSALGSQSGTMAEATQFGKYSIILTLAALAVQLAWALANFWNGTGEAEAALVVAEGRTLIGGILEGIAERVLGKFATSAVTRVIAKQALVGAAFGAGVDAAAQGLQIAQGTRHGFDGKQFLADAAAGTAGGIAGGGLGHAIAGKAAESLAGKIGKAALGGAVGGGAGAVAGGAAAAAVTGNWDHVFDGAGGQMVLGAATGLGSGAREAVRPSGGGAEAVHPVETPKVERYGVPAENGKRGDAGEPAASQQEPSQRPLEHAPSQEREQASLTQHPDDRPAHEQAQPAAAVDQRAPTPEPKPQAEQRSAPAGDQVRTNTPATDRLPANAAQPAPGAPAGERAPAPAATPRVTDQPAAGLSNAASDRPLTGASAAMKDTPVIKAAEPVTAKPGEHVKATGEAGISPEKHAPATTEKPLVDARPTVAPHHAVEARQNEAFASTEPRVDPNHAGSSGFAPLHLDPEHPRWVQDLVDGRAHFGVSFNEAPRVVEAWYELQANPGGEIGQTRGGFPVTEDMRRLFAQEPMVRDTLLIPAEYRDFFMREHIEQWHAMNPDDPAVRSMQHLASRDVFVLKAHPDGLISVSIGDPNTASRVGIFTPGTYSNVHTSLPYGERPPAFRNPGDVDSPGYHEWIDRMFTSTEDALMDTPDIKAAVILNQEYHAPRSLVPGAALKRYAQEGGFSLYNMTHELRAAHQGGGAFTTSLGHSYGSTPQGWAASTPGGIAVDRIANLSGAGMGVNHVSQLRLAGHDPAENHQRVYALMDKGDILNIIHPAQRLAHGTMPHDPAFGAQRVAVDHHLPEGARDFWDALRHKRNWKLLTKNHGRYADLESKSLNNIGRIIAGLDPTLEG